MSYDDTWDGYDERDLEPCPTCDRVNCTCDEGGDDDRDETWWGGPYDDRDRTPLAEILAGRVQRHARRVIRRHARRTREVLDAEVSDEGAADAARALVDLRGVTDPLNDRTRRKCLRCRVLGRRCAPCADFESDIPF